MAPFCSALYRAMHHLLTAQAPYIPYIVYLTSVYQQHIFQCSVCIFSIGTYCNSSFYLFSPFDFFIFQILQQFIACNNMQRFLYKYCTAFFENIVKIFQILSFPNDRFLIFLVLKNIGTMVNLETIHKMRKKKSPSSQSL